MAVTVAETAFAGPLAQRLAGASPDTPSLFWLGQAGFAIACRGRLVLIDPYLSDSLAEKYRGKRFTHERLMQAPIAVDAFPRIDMVLVTHHHTDHLDGATLAPIARAFPACRFVVPRAWLALAMERIGVGAGRLIGVDAGDRVEPIPGWEVAVVRAAHETLERDEDGAHRFLGYVVEAGGVRIYHSGDCVPFDGLVGEVGALSPDIALLPVNGRRAELTEAGVAGNFTVDEAIALSAGIGAGTAIFQHYGMFAFNTVDPAEIDSKIARAGPSCATRLLRARSGVEYGSVVS